MKPKNIFFAFFALVCTAGMTWQLYLVSTIYFSYKVNTAISVGIPTHIEPKVLTFCTRYTDVLDYDKLNRETGRNWTYSTFIDDVRKYQDELTVAEIFDYTPPVNEAIHGVLFRSNTSTKLMNFTRQSAYNYITIDKFCYLEYICYRIERVNDSVQLYNKLAVTPMYSGLIYQIKFTELFFRANIVKIVFHTGLPYKSITTTNSFNTGYDPDTGTTKFPYFDAYSYTLDVLNLPAPYTTNCFDYSSIGFESESQCAESCISNKTITMFNKIPFSSIITKRSSYRMVSEIDLDSSVEIDKGVIEIQNNCTTNSKCQRVACDYNQAITNVFEKPGEAGLRLTITIIVPANPSYKIQTMPQLTTVEFLTYVLSAVSTWTGMSVLSMNPMSVWTRMTSQHKHRNSVTKTKNNLVQTIVLLRQQVCHLHKEMVRHDQLILYLSKKLTPRHFWTRHRYND